MNTRSIKKPTYGIDKHLNQVGLNKAVGYGLVLLMVFVASSVLMATSMSLTLAPTVAAALGAVSMDGTSAKQVALVGLEAAQNNMKSQLIAGTAITTSYRYPASGTTNVTMPTYPGSGASATVGNYYVTVTKARGFTYLLKATATVGNASSVQYKLVQLNGSAPSIPAPPSGGPSPTALFSLRRLLPTYAGSAVRVRCATTGTTMDIGFNGSGEFSLTQLKECLGDETLPLDAVSGAEAAYSLRRLRSGYTGYAIQVRRATTGNPTQDIGFDADGNLDTQALMTFVGSNSAYVKIWYDQSGNNRHLSQNTNSKQPLIVNAGIIENNHNTPTVRFISGSSTTLTTTSVPLTASSTTKTYTFIAVASVLNPTSGHNSIMEQNTSTLQNNRSAALSSADTGNLKFRGELNDWSAPMTVPTNTMFQAVLTVNNNNTNNISIYQDGVSTGSPAASSGPGNDYTDLSLQGTSGFALGSKYSQSNEYLNGQISEAIVYDTVLSTGNRQTIQNNEGHYYTIASLKDGFVTTWYDQSGNGRNATQATTSSQPVIGQVGLITPDGTMRPGVVFDGGDYLLTATSTAWPSGNNNRSIVALYKMNNIDNFSALFGWGSLGNGNASYLSYQPGAGKGRGFWVYNSDMYGGVGMDNAYAHRHLVTTSGTSETLYFNGVSSATKTQTLTTPSNTKMAIGAENSPGAYLTGVIGECMLYNAVLNTTQHAQLETSQKNYYGQ